MLIGLTGYAQSGKDTLANILVEKFGFTRVAFADPIRNLLYEMNPSVKDGGYRVQGVVDGYGWDFAKNAFPEIRTLLQNLGVGARELFGPDFWIQQALMSVKDSRKIVVTDVRFINEADWIKKFEDSHIWRVKRPGVGAVNPHVSETQMNDYKVDQIFLNGGTVEDLEVLLTTRMRAFV